MNDSLFQYALGVYGGLGVMLFRKYTGARAISEEFVGGAWMLLLLPVILQFSWGAVLLTGILAFASVRFLLIEQPELGWLYGLVAMLFAWAVQIESGYAYATLSILAGGFCLYYLRRTRIHPSAR